jgi:hypothetical protein
MSHIALICGLAAWYAYTSNPPKFNPGTLKHNPAIAATWNRSLEERVHCLPSAPELPDVIETTTGKVPTAKINFDGNLDIKTSRYRLIKDDDWEIVQCIGWVGSVPGKIFFWDYDYGKGLDAQHTKRLLTALENDKSISNLTVRVNHNSIFEDIPRMFNEQQVADRNPWLARAIIGVPSMIFEEFWAQFSRGAYYNPLSRTAVTYANIDSIGLHEVGHCKDYSRFSTDWIYNLTYALPPVMLYQEAKASIYAKELLAPEENYQAYRYLIPAFGAYAMFTLAWTSRMLFGKRKDDD